MDMYDVGNKNFSPAMNKLWYCPPVRHGRASPGFVGSVPNDHFFFMFLSILRLVFVSCYAMEMSMFHNL